MTHEPDHEVELYRDGDSYTVIVDLPGYEDGEVEVHWHDRRLHVHAEYSDSDESPQVVFNRHVGVPHEIDAEAIQASFEDDLLEVTLPIVDEADAPGTRIDVD